MDHAVSEWHRRRALKEIPPSAVVVGRPMGGGIARREAPVHWRRRSLGTHRTVLVDQACGELTVPKSECEMLVASVSIPSPDPSPNYGLSGVVLLYGTLVVGVPYNFRNYAVAQMAGPFKLLFRPRVF